MESSRRGRVDRIEAIEDLDLVAFNDGVNPWAPSPFVRNGFKAGRRHFRDRIERWGFTARDRVIDVGCGYGAWTVFLAEVNREVVGLDRSAGGVEMVRRLADHLGFDNVSAEVGKIGALPYPDQSFDAAWCNNVVQFVERGTLLKEIHRLLRPGGRLFLGTCNGSGRVLEKLMDGLAKGGLDHPTARFALTSLRQGAAFDGRPNFASPATMAGTLEAHGFHVDPSTDLEIDQDAPDAAKALPAGLTDSDMAAEWGIDGEDFSGFVDRLEREPAFVAKLLAAPGLCARFPRNLHLAAERL